MRLGVVRSEGGEKVCIRTPSGLFLLERVNRAFGTDWPDGLAELLDGGRLADLGSWYRGAGSGALEASVEALPPEKAAFAPPYRRPGKIWGIGLNYAAHAADLSEKAPTAMPASFMKPATAIIGHGDTIRIPALSERTTAEAELGVIIGRRCKDVPREAWLDVVAGFTTIIDMTAEDILRRNPRYLTLSKSFDTFFSFGPLLVTPDEVDDVYGLKVATVVNGRVHAENVVANMTFPPDELVAFHSSVMTLMPGDIISTGTPGAVPIQDGDRVSCRISGFDPLINSVEDTKKPRQEQK